MENQHMEMEQIVDSTKHRRRKTITISNQHCYVNLTQKVNCNDFVFIKDENNSCRVAKIVEVFSDGNGDKAHVILYIRPDELPKGIKLMSDSGLKIKFHEHELIENSMEAKNISWDAICSNKCTVFKAHENESLTEVLRLNKKYPMAYVCRYKLVKETIYKLVPVSWQPGEEELRHADEFSDFDDQNMYTDTDEQSEAVCDLSATIDQLHLSLTESYGINAKTDAIREQLVSPIKIVNNEVQKITRNANRALSNKKRSSPDAALDNQDVSPSKRNKSTVESINYTIDSPGRRNGRFSSPAQCKMSKIKKNLNESFAEMNDESAQPYKVKMVDEVNSLKVVLYKGRPLRERNDNTTQSPCSTVTETGSHHTRRSTLKTKDTPRDTTKRNVVFNEQTTSENQSNMNTESTPRRRLSKRISSMTASQKISIAADDMTPEAEKPHTRKTASRLISPTKTPKSISRQISVVAQQTSARTPRTPKTPKGVMTPQQTRSLYRSGNLTPSIQSRQETIGGEQSELEMIRERLQVSAVPSSLPCREKEYANIYEFLIGKLTDGSGGCIYISGVPGTGKTATVTQVIKTIQTSSKPKKLPAFDFVDINGMRLTEPRQAYVQIYRQLTGKTLAWAQARDLLEARFTAGSKKSIRPTILLVDELDIICNRKQDVVYNLFDWTVRKGSRLIAITIANTMDLPERVLKLKVASRLGLTRITFQPYTFKQLQEVVMTRLAGSNCFMADAVQLVARKVASVSGDCRRALDICRRATEIAEEKCNKTNKIEINFAHINQALSEMFASPKVRAIKNCTKFEKLFLQAVASEITRTGIEEVEFHRVYWQIGTLAPILGIKSPPTEDQAMLICMALAANRLLIAEDSSAGLYQKIILNATVDDLYYALNVS